MPPKKQSKELYDAKKESLKKQKSSSESQNESPVHKSPLKKTASSDTSRDGAAKKISEQLLPKEKLSTLKVPEDWYAIKQSDIFPEIKIKKRSYNEELQNLRAPVMLGGNVKLYSFLFSSPDVLQKFMELAKEFAVFQNPQECDFLVRTLDVLEKTINKQTSLPKEDKTSQIEIFSKMLRLWQENVERVTPANIFQVCIEGALSNFFEEQKTSPRDRELITKELRRELKSAIKKLSIPIRQQHSSTILQEKDRVPKLLDTPYFCRYKDRPSFLERMLEIFPEKKLDIDFYKNVHTAWQDILFSVMPGIRERKEQTVKGKFEITHINGEKVSKKEAKKANFWLEGILEKDPLIWDRGAVYLALGDGHKLPTNPKLALATLLLFCIQADRSEEAVSILSSNMDKRTKEAMTMHSESGHPIPLLVWMNLMFNEQYDLAKQLVPPLYIEGGGLSKRYEYQNKKYNPISLLQKIQKKCEEVTHAEDKKPTSTNQIAINVGMTTARTLYNNHVNKRIRQAPEQIKEFIYRKKGGHEATKHRERAIKDILCALTEEKYKFNDLAPQDRSLERNKYLNLIQEYLTMDHPSKKEPSIKIPTKFDHVKEKELIPTVSLVDEEWFSGTHVSFPNLMYRLWNKLEESPHKILSNPSKLNSMVALLDNMCSFKDRRESEFLCWVNELVTERLDSHNVPTIETTNFTKNILNKWCFLKKEAMEDPELFFKQCIEENLNDFLKKIFQYTESKTESREDLKVELTKKIKDKLKELSQQPKQCDTEEVMKKKDTRLANNIYFADCAGEPSFIDRMRKIVYDNDHPQPKHIDHILHKECTQIFDILLEEANLRKDLFCVTKVNDVDLSEEDAQKISEWLALILHNIKNPSYERRVDQLELPNNPEAVAAIFRMSFIHNNLNWPIQAILERIKDKDMVQNMRIKCAEDNSDMPVLIGLIPCLSCETVKSFIMALTPEELFLKKYEYQDPKTGAISEYDIVSLWEELTKSNERRKNPNFNNIVTQITELLLEIKKQYCKDLAIEEINKILEVEKQEDMAAKKQNEAEKSAKDPNIKTTDKKVEAKISDSEKPGTSKDPEHVANKALSASRQEGQHTKITGVSIEGLHTDTQKDHDSGSMEH